MIHKKKYFAFYLSKTSEINREIVQQEELHYHPKEVNFPHYSNLLDVIDIYNEIMKSQNNAPMTNTNEITELSENSSTVSSLSNIWIFFESIFSFFKNIGLYILYILVGLMFLLIIGKIVHFLILKKFFGKRNTTMVVKNLELKVKKENSVTFSALNQQRPSSETDIDNLSKVDEQFDENEKRNTLDPLTRALIQNINDDNIRDEY